MAPITYLLGLKVAVTVVFIFSITILPPKSVESLSTGYGETIEQRESVLGSKPPGCVNKCLNCRPCMATLVIPHQRNGFSAKTRGEDDSYYLLSWKCRCGNKLYQP